MAGESSGGIPVSDSNLSLLECLDNNIGLFPPVNQSNVSEKAMETLNNFPDSNLSLLESLDNNIGLFPPVNQSNVSEKAMETLNNLPTISFLDEYKHCLDEYRNGFDDSNDEPEFEDSDDEDIESVESIDTFEEDEDVLKLKQVRGLIEKIVQMSELFNYIKSKMLEKQDKDVRENENESDCVMPPILAKPVRNSWYKFYPPYFKNKFNFSHMKHNDVKLREEYGFLPNFDWVKLPQNSWTLSDRKKFYSFIKEQIIEREVARLKSEQRQLRRMLKEDDLSNIQVCDISKEIEKMSKQSVTKLMEGKDKWEFDWAKISVIGFKNRHSSDECSRFWHLYLKPSINKKPWGNSEDERLVSLVEKYNHQNWEKITEELGTNRSPFQVSIHYEVRFNDQKDVRKKQDKWTPEEDKKFQEVLKSCTFDGEIRWGKVSYLTGRSVMQLWRHYWRSSDPEIVKGRFTKEEDMMIVSGIQEFGFNSIMLSGLLNHRTTSQIMSRYRRLIPDNTIVGPWEIHEDELLMKLVKKHGFGQWSKIAKQFITRSRTQVRQRYNHIQRRMEQKENFDIVEMNRRKSRKPVNKSANVDNMIGKVMKKMKRFNKDLSPECSSKFKQMYDLKHHIFPKPSSKPYWSEDNMLDRKLIDFFHEKCHPCKYVRQFDIEGISDLATRTLWSLVYLNVTTLKTITKADIENDDSVDSLLRSVLLELMDGGVLDLQLPLVKQKLLKLRCAEEMVVENDSADEMEIDYSAPSTSKQVVYKRKQRNNNSNELGSSSSETIDYSPVKQEDSLVDLKERWLYSEIVIENVKSSQLIFGNLDEFSYGVYKFLKEEADCTSQTVIDLCPVLSNKKSQPVLSEQLKKCDTNFDEIYPNNCYKLPVNVSSIIFLRTLELSKIKLEDTLIDEKIIIQDLNELPEVTVNNKNPQFISEARYTRRFNEKEYVSDRAMELPSTKLLINKICDVLYWTMLMTKVKIDCEKPSTNKRKTKLQSRISTSVRLKKRQIRETYINDMHEIPKQKFIRKLRRKKNVDEDNDDDYEEISD